MRNLRGLAVASLMVTSLLANPGAAQAAGATAVSDASAQVSSLSASAYDVTYSVTFQSERPLVDGTSTLTLALPAGATVPNQLCYPDSVDLVTDDVSRTGGCGALSVHGGQVVIKSPVTTAAGDAVTVMLNGVVNPSSPGPKTVYVSTSSAPVPVPLPLTLVGTAAATRASLQLSSYSAQASRVTYSVTFQAPDRFIAADNQKPAITLVAPAGTVFPPYSCGAYQFVDDTQTVSGGCGPSFKLSRGGSTVVVNPPTTAAGDMVSLVIRGVVNGAKPGLHELSVSTSADPRPVELPFSLLPVDGVARAFFQSSSYAGSAKGATWSIGFASPGRLTDFSSPVGDSTVTVVGPPGTRFPAFTGCDSTYVFVDPVDEVDHCAAGAVISDGGSRLVVRPPLSASTPGAVMALVITGVDNPPSQGQLKVSTTSDPAQVSLATGHQTAFAPSLLLDSTSSRATKVTYSAAFVLKSGFNPANCFSGGSKLTLSAPAGTIFPAAGYVFYDLANGSESGAGACPATGTTYTPASTIPLATGIAGGDLSVKPGDFFAVTATSIANTAVSGSHNLLMAASTGTTVSPRYSLTAATVVHSPLVQVLSPAAGATQVHYAVTFRATNGLLPDASGIGLSMAGVRWGPGSGDNDGWTIYDDTTGLAGAGYATYAGVAATPNKPDNPGPVFVDPSTGDGFRAAPGDLLTIATDGTVNPGGAGANTLTLTTSGDPVPASVPVLLLTPKAASLAALNVSPGQAGRKKATFVLTFVSHGGLTPNWSYIQISFPGFTWPPGVGDGDGFAVFDDTTDLAGGGYATIDGKGNFQPEAGTVTVSPSTGDGFYAAAGDVISVSATPGANAAAPGRHAADFYTSADPVPATAYVGLG